MVHGSFGDDIEGCYVPPNLEGDQNNERVNHRSDCGFGRSVWESTCEMIQ